MSSIADLMNFTKPPPTLADLKAQQLSTAMTTVLMFRGSRADGASFGTAEDGLSENEQRCYTAALRVLTSYLTHEPREPVAPATKEETKVVQPGL